MNHFFRPRTRAIALTLVMVSLLQVSLLQSLDTEDQLQANIFDNIHDLIFGSSSSAKSVKNVTTHKAASSSIASIAETSSATSFAPSFTVPTQSWFTVQAYRFPRTIRTGMLGDDVLNLQLILNRNAQTQMAKTGAESPGQETGTFDYKTRIGIIAFQKLNLITAEQLTRLRREQGFAGLTTRVALEKIAKDLVAQGQLPSDTKNLHAAAQSAASSLRLLQSSRSSRSTISTASESSASSVVVTQASSVTSVASSTASTASTSSVASTVTSQASSVTSQTSSSTSTVSSVASSIASSIASVSSAYSAPSNTPTVVYGDCPAPSGTPIHAFYIDPATGDKANDGSQAHPWKSLTEVINMKLINGQDTTTGKVHAGDIIYLMSGNYGPILMNPYQGGGKFKNTDFITIQAAPGQTPIIEGFTATTVSKWVFKGLTIQNPVGVKSHYLANLDGSSNIVFTNNALYSEADASHWTVDDWNTKAASNAVFWRGTCGAINYNTVSNIRFGIVLSGGKVLASYNTVDNFADDGMRFTDGDMTLSHNVITNHYGIQGDGNHNDGIQGWTTNNPVAQNLVLDSNIVIESLGNHPWIPLLPTGIDPDYLQGISIFDGKWNNLTAINNVVAISAWHGLSFYGLSNSLVANNTIIKQSSNPSIGDWLGIMDAKDGSAPLNVIVRNNIANNYSLTGGVLQDHNLSLGKKPWNWDALKLGPFTTADRTTVFVNSDPSTGPLDLSLKAGSPAIGAGNSVGAPGVDVTGKARNPASIDIGAYAK